MFAIRSFVQFVNYIMYFRLSQEISTKGPTEQRTLILKPYIKIIVNFFMTKVDIKKLKIFVKSQIDAPVTVGIRFVTGVLSYISAANFKPP